MKNLIAKAGVIAASSVLLTTAVSVGKAQALDLTASQVGSLYFCEIGCLDRNTGGAATNYVDINPTPGDVGEFVNGEVRTFAEYDLSSFADIYANDLLNGTDQFINLEFALGFDIFSDIGSGDIGSTNGGATDASAYEGLVNVFWYLNSAPFGSSVFGSPLIFDPVIGGIFNPLYSFDTNDYSAGDRIAFDVTSLVHLLITNGVSSFGILLDADIADAGSCGPINGATRQLCSGTQFNNFDVAIPTPAAILPTLIGFASAAFRKKKQEEEMNA
jgi:hypothetical protein